MVKDLANPEVSVELDGRGMGKVHVGGVDIGRHIETVTVQTKAGERTTVTLGMPFAGAKATGEVQLDEETSKALEALGWTGPDEMLLRRRDLQEALGGLGAVLRTWDELLQIARAIESDAAGNLEGAKTQLRTALAEFGPQGEEPDWETLMMCVHGVAHRLSQAKRDYESGNGDQVLGRVAAAMGDYAPSELKWSRVIEEITELAGRMEGLEK